MNKTLAKNNGKVATKRAMKVKKDPAIIPSDNTTTPKKRGRKALSEKVAEATVDVSLGAVYDLVDPQLDELIDGNRIKVGKLWMQLRKGLFSVHISESVRKNVFEAIADSDGLGYNKTLAYLSRNC